MVGVSELRSELVATLSAQIERGGSRYILSSPHVLYVTDGQATLFEAATNRNDSYRRSINQPIDRLLHLHATNILGNIEGKTDFIDLGPGDPPNSFRIVDWLCRKNGRIKYFAVDISRPFLELALSAAKARFLDAYAIQCRFEELAPILEDSLDPTDTRIIFIGLTFNNFCIFDISKTLANLTRQQDICLVCAQLPDGKSSDELVAPYTGNNSFLFGFQPLAVLGLSPEQVIYKPSYYDDAVNIDFILSEEVAIGSLSLKAGSIVTTGRSFRYPLPVLKEALSRDLAVSNEFIDSESNIALIAVRGRRNG